jgi:hypothetical protein
MATRFLLLATLSILVVPLAITPASAQSLKAGAATSNITPPIGQNIVGGFSPASSTHVHDELHARCLVELLATSEELKTAAGKQLWVSAKNSR